MAINTQTIRIDLNPDRSIPVAYSHQGDTARSFMFEVYNNGEAFPLTGYTAKIAAMLPADDGYRVIAGDNMADGAISENTITATLPADFTAKPGRGVLTIVLTGSGATIRPINIDLRIQKSADAPETIAGASDFVPVLQRYMAEDMQTYINAWLDAHPEAMQYYISGSKLVLDENGILSIQNDTDEIVEALDLDTLRAEVTDLKSEISEVVPGVNNRFDALLIKKSGNIMPQLVAADIVAGYLLSNGTATANASYSYCAKYIPIEPYRNYMIGFVPIYGSAKVPWMTKSKSLEFYDKNQIYISSVTTDGAFTSPPNAYYIRFNLYSSAGISYITCNSRLMLVDGDSLPETFVTYDGVDEYISAELVEEIAEGSAESAVAEVDDKIHYVSPNLFDESLQTTETIDPHYYVDGVPYSGTPDYSNSYNCTAPFEIEPNTEYTIGIVPGVNNVSKPWGRASYGIFFYNSNNVYISGTVNATFTTPATAKYARFNYALMNGITLDVVKSRCMLVKGATLPVTFEPYYDYYVKARISEIEAELDEVKAVPNINYIISESGNSVTLISKYSSDYDIAINLKKKGGNNLFDFNAVGLIANSTPELSTSTAGIEYIMSASGDWFSPFIVKAKNNADGDLPSSGRFTGGNHQYNNESSGSTATARTSKLILLADNMAVTSGSGGCKRFEMIWTNLVQGYNTTKENGTGREILQEDHRLIFDGIKFEAFVDLIPLEDIVIQTWYGFQWFCSQYPNIRYIGGANRGVYDSSSVASKSGDATCCHVLSYSTNNEIRVDVDETYDLGDHKFYNDAEGKAIFTETYGKGYFFIIKDTNLDENDMYSLHGWYTFRAHN